jgi:hypothetical protein
MTICAGRKPNYLWKNTLAMYSLFTTMILSSSAGAAEPASSGLILSRLAAADFPLQADPESAAWKGIPGVIADRNSHGQAVPGHRTEIRSRWTPAHLYLLFICPYQELYLTPHPKTDSETNQLWDWDVAEAFIGSDFQNIKHYTEFQVSPQGEWVDLDIDRSKTPALHDWHWNSGYQVKARLDRDKQIWYGEMKIPMNKIDTRPPAVGQLLRINFYRLQGPPPNRKGIAWQPTNSDSYHVPEAFGQLRLEK